jgi:hypothetical protein
MEQWAKNQESPFAYNQSRNWGQFFGQYQYDQYDQYDQSPNSAPKSTKHFLGLPNMFQLPKKYSRIFVAWEW